MRMLPLLVLAGIQLPMSQQVWLTAEYSVTPGRTEVLGLHDQDVLDAGELPFTRAWGGFTMGF